MKKFKDIKLSKNTEISLRIPINGDVISIDVLVNGKVYGNFLVPKYTTGEFKLGEISYSDQEKNPKWKFPLSITGLEINTGIVKAKFERNKD